MDYRDIIINKKDKYINNNIGDLIFKNSIGVIVEFLDQNDLLIESEFESELELKNLENYKNSKIAELQKKIDDITPYSVSKVVQTVNQKISDIKHIIGNYQLFYSLINSYYSEEKDKEKDIKKYIEKYVSDYCKTTKITDIKIQKTLLTELNEKLNEYLNDKDTKQKFNYEVLKNFFQNRWNVNDYKSILNKFLDTIQDESINNDKLIEKIKQKIKQTNLNINYYSTNNNDLAQPTQPSYKQALDEISRHRSQPKTEMPIKQRNIYAEPTEGSNSQNNFGLIDKFNNKKNFLIINFNRFTKAQYNKNLSICSQTIDFKSYYLEIINKQSKLYQFTDFEENSQANIEENIDSINGLIDYTNIKKYINNCSIINIEGFYLDEPNKTIVQGGKKMKSKHSKSKTKKNKTKYSKTKKNKTKYLKLKPI
jgi:hypothetical protein